MKGSDLEVRPRKRRSEKPRRVVWCNKHWKEVPTLYKKDGSMTPEYEKMKCFDDHPDHVTWRTIGLKPKRVEES